MMSFEIRSRWLGSPRDTLSVGIFFSCQRIFNSTTDSVSLISLIVNFHRMAVVMIVIFRLSGISPSSERVMITDRPS